jgi:hypothetical protein
MRGETNPLRHSISHHRWPVAAKKVMIHLADLRLDPVQYVEAMT